jgi:hypothetical protein
VRETVVEAYLRKRVEECGGLCEKHVSPGRKGVPDRLVTIPYRNEPNTPRMELVETKAPGKKPRADQVRDHERRAKLGIVVRVIDTKAKVDNYIAGVFGG